MELDTPCSLWNLLGLFLFLTFTFASETNGTEGEVASSFKSSFFISSPKYHDDGVLQLNLSSVTKRKVTARKEALLTSTEDVTTDVRDLKIPDSISNFEKNSEKAKESKIAQGDTGDHVTPTKSNHLTVLDTSIVSVVSPSRNASNQQISSVAPISVLSPQEILKISTNDSSSTPAYRKKNKPGVTYDENDLPRDENGTIILPKEGLVGSEPSFDYIVPIVVAMLTVPFLAVIGVFLFKRARDFWDRRHYRRMDFLIDGMYND